MDQIGIFIDSIYNEVEKVLLRKEIVRVKKINQNEGETKTIKYLEITLSEVYLNEKDADLIDIEISYSQLNDNQFEIKGEFYASDGCIYKEFYSVDIVNNILQEVESFLKKVTNELDAIIDIYVMKS